MYNIPASCRGAYSDYLNREDDGSAIADSIEQLDDDSLLEMLHTSNAEINEKAFEHLGEAAESYPPRELLRKCDPFLAGALADAPDEVVARVVNLIWTDRGTWEEQLRSMGYTVDDARAAYAAYLRENSERLWEIMSERYHDRGGW